MAADARVYRIEHQPFVVHYRLNGELHEYIPDYKVEWISKPFILEVKELVEASNQENQARFPEIARVLASEGYEFRVWTEDDFRRQPLLSNSTYILRYRNYPIDEELINQVTGLLSASKQLRTSEFRSQIGPQATTAALFAMVCLGHIYTDCSQELSSDPRFSVVSKNAPPLSGHVV